MTTSLLDRQVSNSQRDARDDADVVESPELRDMIRPEDLNVLSKSFQTNPRRASGLSLPNLLSGTSQNHRCKNNE